MSAPAPGSRVPRLAEAMLKALLDSGCREFVMGDLEEEYLNRRARRGAVNSYFWYWRHTLGSIIAQAKSARAGRSRAAAPRPAQRRTVGMFVLGLAGDAKFALRSLRQNPMFSIVAIGTLTLGIGANTAIFTVVDSVVLRQLPYEDAERVVAVWPEIFFSQEQFDRFREQITSYDYLTAYSQNGFTRSDRDVAELVMGPHVSAEFFSVLGASMQFGRGFVEGEDRPGAAPVVVISHGLSQREFGDGASPIGRTIGLDGTLRTIVGVLPQGFDAIQRDAEVFIPLRLDPADDMYTAGRYLRVIGRRGWSGWGAGCYAGVVGSPVRCWDDGSEHVLLGSGDGVGRGRCGVLCTGAPREQSRSNDCVAFGVRRRVTPDSHRTELPVCVTQRR